MEVQVTSKLTPPTKLHPVPNNLPEEAGLGCHQLSARPAVADAIQCSFDRYSSSLLLSGV